MERDPTHYEQAWRNAMANLGRVNGSVEVHTHTPADTRGLSFNARVLEAHADAGGLVIERPPSLAGSALAPGAVVRLFALLGDTRLAARSRVARSGRYRLNPEVRVTAVELEPVTAVQPSQRRASFRVSTLGSPVRGVTLTHPEHPSVAAEVLDLSEAGAALGCTLTPPLVRVLRGARVRIALPLDPDQAALEVDAEVVRLDPRSDGVWKLGLRFTFASPVERHHAERIIQRFSTDRQRLHLRRLRDAG